MIFIKLLKHFSSFIEGLGYKYSKIYQKIGNHIPLPSRI